jgi:pyridinium-3,5-biscarboxylic acid mononucleotide sulfurtransferase
MKAFSQLEAWFLRAGSAVLGYSGGVDSALLAVVGTRVLGRDRFLAVIGRSASYPDAQWQQARDLATSFGIPTAEVETDELADPSYRANPTNRCYFCKRELWRHLDRVKEERGFTRLVDGTNADDLLEHRPGAVAGTEGGVRSPLAELGWTKTDVRRAGESLGLPNWYAPAEPCLASRIRYGLEVTEERLSQVERAERFLRGIGVVGNLRVRHHGRAARIEVDRMMFDLVQSRWDQVIDALRSYGFVAVALEPEGYRRGALLPLAAGTS